MCCILEILTLQTYAMPPVTLKGHSRSSEVASSHTSFYWRPTVTVALSCIVSEIKRDIGRKSQICVSNPPLEVNPSKFRPTENDVIKLQHRLTMAIISYTVGELLLRDRSGCFFCAPCRTERRAVSLQQHV